MTVIDKLRDYIEEKIREERPDLITVLFGDLGNGKDGFVAFFPDGWKEIKVKNNGVVL